MSKLCVPCLISKGKKKREQIARKENKIAKDEAKTRPQLLKELETEFNKFIRLRDADEPCISCGTTSNVVYAAGHFYPTTYSFLRFNEDNVNKQCNTYCNCKLRGNLHEYRVNLIKKIGIERVTYLDENKHKPFELSKSEIKDLIIYYKQKIKSVQVNP